MSASIKYAYLKGHTWLYRRHYPRDVTVVTGVAALKQSLKTGDANRYWQWLADYVVNRRYP